MWVKYIYTYELLRIYYINIVRRPYVLAPVFFIFIILQTIKREGALHYYGLARADRTTIKYRIILYFSIETDPQVYLLYTIDTWCMCVRVGDGQVCFVE